MKLLNEAPPAHYEINEFTDVNDVIKWSLTEEEYRGFAKGNAIKYLLRDGKKTGGDIVKCKDYMRVL